MKHNSDFKYDLMIGNIYEEKLSVILSQKKIEIKTDFIAHKTGNIAVEYQCRGKPSGIATTQADYYAYIIPRANCQDIILLMRVDKLKGLCRQYFKQGAIKKMGDNDLSVAVLIPINELFMR